MYTVFIWNIEAVESSRIVKELKVSPETASILINLDEKEFPYLSILSFIDIDLFGGNLPEELDGLIKDIEELLNRSVKENKFLNDLSLLIKEAKAKKLWILFNPFIS